MVEKIHLL